MPASTPVSELHAFRFANRAVVALDDAFRRQCFGNGLSDQVFALIHRQRQGLQCHIVAIAVDDDSREAIAFAPNDPAQFWTDAGEFLPVLDRPLDPPHEEIAIEHLFPSGKTTRDDLRLRIVDRRAQHPVSLICEGNY